MAKFVQNERRVQDLVLTREDKEKPTKKHAHQRPQALQTKSLGDQLRYPPPPRLDLAAQQCQEGCVCPLVKSSDPTLPKGATETMVTTPMAT